MQTGYLGIDIGTQGLSVVFVNETGTTIATGEGQYGMVPNLESGCYEQQPHDWEAALIIAMNDLRERLAVERTGIEVRGIGISGQMHGEVLVGEDGSALGNARLWCDSRNENEGFELTDLFGVKVPKRMTVARWLWTIRNQAGKASQVRRMMTPGGWLAYRLTGESNLGIGDASGMFPIDQATLDYDEQLLQRFEHMTKEIPVKSIRDLMPTTRRAGEEGGALNENGSRLLGLPVGIPVAPAEGDQPASLAGSLIGSAGLVAISFGTSVCANAVGDRTFRGVHQAIDHFCAPDGQPINMVFLRNGTTFMNALVDMFSKSIGEDRSVAMSQLMADVLESHADCGGVLASPFMDDEPGLGVGGGGQGALFGFAGTNATPGNAIKAALLATMYNLKLGVEVLDQQSFPRTEMILSGGLTRTPELAQILADVMQSPVTVTAAASDGCAYGAALLARYRVESMNAKSTSSHQKAMTWEQFLQQRDRAASQRFNPNATNAKIYQTGFHNYQKLLQRLLD